MNYTFGFQYFRMYSPPKNQNKTNMNLVEQKNEKKTKITCRTVLQQGMKPS